MNWILLVEILYIIAIILVCLRIIYDTEHTIKSLAYLLLVIFVPMFGMIFYFSFGFNYRKRKMYKNKLIANSKFSEKLKKQVSKISKNIYEHNKNLLSHNRELIFMLLNSTSSSLTDRNEVKLLINGESKFPEVLKAMESAEHHIHLEYYIFKDDEIGKKIEEVLIRKAYEGVEVRFIFDDYGSHPIRNTLAPRLRKHGIEVVTFRKVRFVALANRLNFRNHRKIIVVDGKVGFVGGINVGDNYINKKNEQKFWRDTHLSIHGPGVRYLQFLFMSNWNFCAADYLVPSQSFFPDLTPLNKSGNKIVQIAASGPDSEHPYILYAILQAINLASEEILITTPYLIPTDSIIDALLTAAMGGVKVKILVPEKGDSLLVNNAAKSYYEELVKAGIEIYLYQKGFVHAKTLVADRRLAIVGTANMDYRSFNLNFEVNAHIHDKDIADELAEAFYSDIKDARLIDKEQWENRPLSTVMIEKLARLVSPLI